MNSIADLTRCAARHLAEYTDASGNRAFWSYDRRGDPARLEPVDALASGLLNAPLRGVLAIQLFADRDSEYSRLRQAMQRLLDETVDVEPAFEDLNLEDQKGPWNSVQSVLDCTDTTWGIKAAIATKILHRKRPRFVPIFDSMVAAFYGTPRRTPRKLWPRLQSDIRSNTNRLHELCDQTMTPDRRRLSPLRAADIVIWEHQMTGCGMATPG